MPPLDKTLLKKAMDKAGVSTKRLSDEAPMSLQYACDLVSGHRNLKRNPALRKRIAEVLDVPVHWIEHHETTEVA
ncbi:MAG: helix-turn-helix transcriptional regulator [Actinomycetota bacterium]|nr:helix-turn-helix transcriptional regulator [Actinomycetota bacterium]